MFYSGAGLTNVDFHHRRLDHLRAFFLAVMERVYRRRHGEGSAYGRRHHQHRHEVRRSSQEMASAPPRRRTRTT